MTPSHPLPSEPDLAALLDNVFGPDHVLPGESNTAFAIRLTKRQGATDWLAANLRPDVGLREALEQLALSWEREANRRKDVPPTYAHEAANLLAVGIHLTHAQSIRAALAANPEPARDGLDVGRLAEAIFRVGIGLRKGMTPLPWAVEHEREWAKWAGNGQVAAEYDRLAPDRDAPREPA